MTHEQIEITLWTYKQIATTLCEGFLDMPCGCEGCPLYDENMVCDLEKLRSEEKNMKEGAK